MPTYTIGTRGNSLVRLQTYQINGTLTEAKRAATKEFGGDFNGVLIVIMDEFGNTVARRRIGDKKWTDLRI